MANRSLPLRILPRLLSITSVQRTNKKMKSEIISLFYTTYIFQSQHERIIKTSLCLRDKDTIKRSDAG